ncbi:glycosyltransferase [Kocuria sp. LUK]|uniref:glycosyltransferase n=1 Tax=Kocuria sp. LUK TaxID=2897828 RepID=UPI001E49D0F0|nr:glycosyltransferase [Kocuria sp. LUK]MCD1144956.1 glycosyltransferase [Kocuria sp. LUK]
MRHIALAHDYFVQMGGAERVAAAWASHFGSSTISTLAYDQRNTFSTIDPSKVKAKLYGAFWSKHLHKFLPTLPLLARSVVVDNADVALVSTSGWAHQFRYNTPTVAYVHSPARWLYAAEDYKMGLSSVPRAGLYLTSNYLKQKDAPAMGRMDRLISNSVVTQERIWSAYGVDSEVVSPPVSPIAAQATAPARPLPDQFLLIVARNRGYKRIREAAEIARKAGRALVVIGGGTEELDTPEEAVIGLGRVSDGELKWLYQHADVLLATGREDFGLTVLEANLEGTPVVGIPSGGYLETIKPGVNGQLTSSQDLDSFGPAIFDALKVPANSCRQWATKFSLENHLTKLEEVMDDVAS